MAIELNGLNGDHIPNRQYAMDHIGGGFTGMVQNPTADTREEFVRNMMAGGDQSYYEKAKEQFIKIFGNGNNRYVVSEEAVSDAVSRLYVNGESYDKRYHVQVNKDNYDMVLCHIVDNLTNGEIAQSFRQENGLQAVVFSSDSVAEAKVQAVVPPKQEPPVPEKPQQPNGFKRFLNRFGFFKRDIADYNTKKQDYDQKVKERDDYLHAYEENCSKTENTASNVDRKITERGIAQDPQRVQQTKNVYASPEQRRALREAALSVYEVLPKNQDVIDAQIAREFIPGYDPKTMGVKVGVAGSGRTGSIRSQLYAYMMAFGNNGAGMTLDEALSCNDLEEKKRLGREYAETFMMSDKKDLVPTEEQRQKACAAMAKMFEAMGKEQMRSVDVLDPASIRTHAAHNSALGNMAMDLAQMLPNGETQIGRQLREGVERNLHLSPEVENLCAESGERKVDFCTNATTGFRGLSMALDSAVKIYTTPEFESGQMNKKPDGARLNHVPLMTVYKSEADSLCGKNLFSFTKEEVARGTFMDNMAEAKDPDVFKLLKGEEVQFNKVSERYLKAAAYNIMKNTPDASSLFQPNRVQSNFNAISRQEQMENVNLQSPRTPRARNNSMQNANLSSSRRNSIQNGNTRTTAVRTH